MANSLVGTKTIPIIYKARDAMYRKLGASPLNYISERTQSRRNK